MSLSISVDVLGDRVISRRFVRIGRNAADFTEAWDTILDAFEDWTGEQFASDGSFFGTPWEPLTEGTIAQKERERAADPAQALVRSGALALSFLGGPGHVRHVDAGEAEWGSHNPDAMWHHGRQRSASNPVPRRPIFEPDEPRRRWVMNTLQRHVFGGLG